MSEAPTVLAVIPAKAHSSRVPSKNLQPLGGIPLFLWTVQAARAVRPATTVMVSTDEGPAGDEIAKLAVVAGAVVVRRPPELCRDPAQAPDVALHALERYREQRGAYPDTVALLLPTSPFRTVQQIEEALALHFEGWRQPNVWSVTDASAYLHHKLCVCRADRLIAGPPLRDLELRKAMGGLGDLTQAVLLNGAIQIAAADVLRRDRHVCAIGALPYVMDEESSLDIDTPLNLEVARAIVARRYQTVTLPFGHNEVAAVCRAVLESEGISPNDHDGLIYRFAAGYNGTRSVTATRSAFVEYRRKMA